ncbi:hypothetical protein [Streptomyces sp. NPDC026589]|uniref:hypothetical protein n=1 Tax=Streptomyces sp. NPDC026589 TaxID=3155609 RepID=UPI003405544B
MSGQVLVLWDIDRTLLYVGDIDRQAYRDTYHELTGRSAGTLPKRGTGTTMPLAILRMLVENGIAEDEAASLLPTPVELLPQAQRRRIDDIRRDGVLLPGQSPRWERCMTSRGSCPRSSPGTSSPTHC